MMLFKKQPKLLGDVLEQALKKWKLQAPLARHEVLNHWEQIVGPSLAQRTKPLKIQGKQLIVQAEHPAWVQELSFIKDHLISKVQKLYPKSQIKNIRFVLK